MTTFFCDSARAEEARPEAKERQIGCVSPDIPDIPGVTRPYVSDPRLKNLMDDLYKGDKTANPVGTGSTADAIRYEMRTGQQVGGRWHTQKGQDYARALEKWLKKNPNAPVAERTAAQQVLDDLRAALREN